VTFRTSAYETSMRRALQLARAQPFRDADDPPVGAVLYESGGEEIAAAYGDRTRSGDPTADAVMLALRQAGQARGSWRLDGCILVTTLEPGTMSAGAIVLARVATLVIGAWDQYNGAVSSLWDVVRDSRLNHFVEVVPGILEHECHALLDATGYPA
jgi:tRNA(adenine34) deaminase